MSLIHATCIAIAGIGVVIRGPSGAGKSDLALRLIDAGATLVADDYCEATVARGRLTLAAPANIAGKMEVRGYGIVRLPQRQTVAAGLVVDLMPEAEIARMPNVVTCTLEGVTLPWLAVDAFSASAAAKVRLAVRGLTESLRVSPEDAP
jgi:HPr kinase/phosphorylase